MKNWETLKKHLEKFEWGEDGRQKMSAKLDAIKKGKTLNTDEGRKEYSDVIGKCFLPCAQAILAGHFCVKNNEGEVVRKIYPTVIELYYHEEKEDGFKDPIMYHTKDRKYYDYYLNKQGHLTQHGKNSRNYFEKRGISDLPYFPLGSLNPHASGIDITFENPDKQYRASFLIREYDFYSVEKEEVLGFFHCPNSTDIYDDMLISGISLENADWLDWVEGDVMAQEPEPEEYFKKHCTFRKNVPAYEPANVHPGDKHCPKLWRKRIKADSGNKSGDLKYEHCPFKWQFHKAEIPQKK